MTRPGRQHRHRIIAFPRRYRVPGVAPVQILLARSYRLSIRCRWASVLGVTLITFGVALLHEQGPKDGPIAVQLGMSRQKINAIRQKWRRKRRVDV